METLRDFKFRAWSNERKVFIANCYPLGYSENYGFNLCGISQEGNDETEEDDGIILMQWTGLKDKNGKDIYEGDIVAYLFYESIVHEISEVKWRSDAGGFSINNYPMNIHGLHDIEIIGNIHENAGLLAVAP